MIVIKIPAVLVLLRCCVFEAGVLLDTRMVTTGPRESTVSVSARTLITVTLLSFSVWLSLKQTLLPPARATSIVIVTTANQTQWCRGGSGARKNCFYDWTLRTWEGRTWSRRRLVPFCWLQNWFRPSLSDFSPAREKSKHYSWRASTHRVCCSSFHAVCEGPTCSYRSRPYLAAPSILRALTPGSHQTWITHRTLWGRENSHHFCWIPTKTFVARAKQKCQKTK